MRKCQVLILASCLALAVGAPGQEFAQRRSRPAAEQNAPAGRIFQEGKYWVEEQTGTVPAGSRIHVQAAAGAIDLRGGQQHDITYRVRKSTASCRTEEAARRYFAEHPLQIGRRGSAVVFEVENGGSIETDYWLVVPKSTARADLESGGGAILARGIDGTVHAETAGGAISADGIGGNVEVNTAGGAIDLGTIGGRVRAETAGGVIRLVSSGADVAVASQGGSIELGDVSRSVRAETAGGDIRVRRAGGDVLVETAGGNIHVGEARQVRAETAGGSINVEKALALITAETAGGSIKLLRCGGAVRAETASGSITAAIAAARSAFADSLFETSVGDIVLYMPSDLGFTIRAAIDRAQSNNAIHSDFPLTVRGGAGPGPRELVGEGAVNGGGPQVRLRTTSGKIEIRSQK